MSRRGSGKDSSQTRHIADLFAVYKKRLRAPERSVVLEVVVAIEEVVGVKVSDSQCRYNAHTRTVSLQVSGMIKDQVRMRAPEILTKLERKLGKRSCPQAII